jgi:Peptidase family M41
VLSSTAFAYVFATDTIQVTTGASNDLQQVASIAKRMVSQWGMSDKLGQIVVDDGGQRYYSFIHINHILLVLIVLILAHKHVKYPMSPFKSVLATRLCSQCASSHHTTLTATARAVVCTPAVHQSLVLTYAQDKLTDCTAVTRCYYCTVQLLVHQQYTNLPYSRTLAVCTIVIAAIANVNRQMGQPGTPWGPKITQTVDEEIERIVNNAYVRCKEILTKNMDLLERLAQRLLEVESVTAEELSVMIMEQGTDLWMSPYGMYT